MSDQPFNEIGITNETRKAMYPDNYTDKMGHAFKTMLDDIFRPMHIPRPDPVDHSILIDELEMMYEAHMTIGGQQNRFNASVLKAALNVIRAL